MWDLIVSVPDHCLSFYSSLWSFASASDFIHIFSFGWLGWAIVLGSRGRDVVLPLHTEGQGSALLSAGSGRVGYIYSIYIYIFFFFFFFLLSSMFYF